MHFRLTVCYPGQTVPHDPGILKLPSLCLRKILGEPDILMSINQHIDSDQVKTCAKNILAVPIVRWFFGHHTLMVHKHTLLWIWII